MAQPAAPGLGAGTANGRGNAASGVAGPGHRPAPGRARRRLSTGHTAMLLAGLLAALLNLGVLRAADRSTLVAVAATAIRPGQALSAAQLRVAPVRAEPELLGALVGEAELSELAGWISGVALAPGDVVRRADLRPPSAPAALRAMSVPVALEHAVGGALAPSDRVDVITVRDGVAAYVLVDVEVLAVTGAERAGVLALGSQLGVTLAVDARQALELAAAVRGGGIILVRATGAQPLEGAAAAAPAPATAIGGLSGSGGSAATDEAGNGGAENGGGAGGGG